MQYLANDYCEAARWYLHAALLVGDNNYSFYDKLNITARAMMKQWFSLPICMGLAMGYPVMPPRKLSAARGGRWKHPSVIFSAHSFLW